MAARPFGVLVAITVGLVVVSVGGRAYGLCGDCNFDGTVTAAEAALCQDINDGNASMFSCIACDCDGNGLVSPVEVTIAENNATPGCCPDNVVCQCAPPTATAVPVMPTSTPPPTETAGATETPAATPTPTAAPPVCVGDCDGNGSVEVNNIIVLVNIALDNASASACPHGVPAGTTVDISLIVRAVNNDLNGCPS